MTRRGTSANARGLIGTPARTELTYARDREVEAVLEAAAPVGHAHTNLMKVHHLGSPANGSSS